MSVNKATRGSWTKTYILMASKRKNNNRKTAEEGNWTGPMAHTNRTPILHCITLDETIHNQENQIAHGYQGSNTSILQRI